MSGQKIRVLTHLASRDFIPGLLTAHPFDISSIPCSCTVRVNLINKLFSRHANSIHARQTTYKWGGQSGKDYLFHIYPLSTVLRNEPGIYIYAKQLSFGEWSPIYISQSRDLHQRLEGHVTVHDAIDNGATHLHAHYCPEGPCARFSEESDLIKRWQPVCNALASA